MPATIKEKEVLEALSVFKEPVTMDKIVRYVAKSYKQPEEKVKNLVEEALNGGVRNDSVQKHNEFYYRVSDALDAINDESSEEDDDGGEVESAESYESVDSGNVPPPEPKSKKPSEGKSSGRSAPSHQHSESKKVNKREERWSKKPKDHVCSDGEEEEDEGEDGDEDDLRSERHRRFHKCNSDCYGSHRRRSMDDHGYLRARSRSVSHRR